MGDECRNEYAHAPKRPGLWIRLTMVDGSTLDGVIPNDLMELSYPIQIMAKGGLLSSVSREEIKLIRVVGTVQPPKRPYRGTTSKKACSWT